MDDLQICPPTLDRSIDIDTTATLYYAIVPSKPVGSELNNGLLCARLEVTNDDDNDSGWIGLAISTNGGMVDSEAIIGLPEDESVLKYDMKWTSPSGVTPMDDDKQTLRDTSFEEDEDGKMIMKFTKMLVEEDENEISIVEEGMNIFLYAQGYDRELDFHHTYMSFSKDFAEDQEVVALMEDDTLMTNNQTSTPSSSPSISPGSVTRYICTEDWEDLEQKDCDEERFPDWYTDDTCDGKCKGKKSCESMICVTDRPTLSPTSSALPSFKPTSSPLESPSLSSPSSSPEVAVTLSSTTIPSTDALAGDLEEDETMTNTTTTVATAESKFSFIFPEEDDPTDSISLSPFRLEFVVATDNNDEDRRRQLRGDDLLLFQSAQDVELLSLVSTHLLTWFEMKLDGEPISVELGIDEKSSAQEIEGRGEKVMVSYNFIGYAVYAAAGDDSSFVPNTADLDEEVLDAFNSRKGKRLWMEALEDSEDDMLQRTVSTDASTNSLVVGSGLDPSKAQENENDNLVDGSASEGSSGSTLAPPFVALIASAFAATFIIIGLLTHRKYKRYQQNNNSNDYHNYQNRKKKISLGRNAKKLKQYDHFESPEGSVASHQSEYPICDLEIVGGDTLPASQSDGDPISPAGKQFNPNDETVPYDEEDANNPAVAAYDMTYFSQAAHQMMDDDPSRSRIDSLDDETLEGLYSDKDSYFGSTVVSASAGGGGGGHHRRGDSIHTLDSLDNTFGFANESILHLIDGIEDVMETSNETNSSPVEEDSGDDSGYPSLACTDNRGHIGEIVLDKNVTAKGANTDDEEVDTPVFEDTPPEEVTPENNDDSLKCRVDDSLSEAVISSDDHQDNEEAVMLENTDDIVEEDGAIEFDESPTNTSEKSTTDDELFARITEKTDNRSEQDVPIEFDESSPTNTSEMSATDELFARIAELESKILNTESQLAQDESIKLPTPSKVEMEEPLSTPLPSTTDSSSIQKGIFTEDTLGMIEQSRLTGTPPPSESELDNEMIKEAKENTLLGKYLDDTDSEEESVFEN